MPVLRSAKSKKLLPPLITRPKPRSLHTLVRKNSTRARVKMEPMRSMSSNDLRTIACLQSSPSEVKFSCELCEETLKELMQDRENLNCQIQTHCELNGRKDVEASKLVKKMWEEAKKRAGYSKQSLVKGKGVLSKLTPADMKRVFDEAKKLSNQMKMKRKMLMIKKQRLESKIHLAIDIIKVCRKYLNNRR